MEVIRRFQFVGDRIQEAVLALIAADFADDENSVYDQAGNDHAEENDTENQRDRATPMVHDPANVEKNGEAHQEAP